jgi:Dynamin family
MIEPFLTGRLSDFLSWRTQLQRSIDQVRGELARHGLLEGETALALDQLLERAHKDRLSIAFVSEAERGKSELINALFFSERRRRLLPSGPGRSTLCVTELRHDPDLEPGVRLLPIETREQDTPYEAWLEDLSTWRFVPFMYEDFDSIQRALVSLSETRRVTLAEAVAWGLHAEAAGRRAQGSGTLLDVPRWRHAIINMPHPVLQAGLVVIDTPGLSALAAEPELSRKRLPLCDCVVYVIDGPQGLTKPDISIWRDYLAPNPPGNAFGQHSRQVPHSTLVAVNKIDHFYDQHENNSDALRDIDRVVKEVSDLLRVEPMSVIPLSARLGYIGKTSGDRDKLVRSRLYQLERALTRSLSDQRQQSFSAEARRLMGEQIDLARGRLDEERFDILGALRNMSELRERNQKLIGSLSGQASSHLERYETALKEVRQLRMLHGRMADGLAVVTDRDRTRREIDAAGQALAAGLMPGAIEEAVAKFLQDCRERIENIEGKVNEVKSIYEQASVRMTRELGMPAMELLPFSTQRFYTELQKAESELKETAALSLKRGAALEQHFHDTCGSRVRHLFEIAARESSLWMRGMLAALDKSFERMKDSSLQRAQGTEKLKLADIDLAEKISEVQARMDVIKSQHEGLAQAQALIERLLAEQD